MNFDELPSAALDVRGSGPAVVLVHGLGGTLNVWEPLVRSLAGRVRTIRFDMRGSGRHPASGDLSIDQWVQDLTLLLDRLETDQAVFIGHSLGTLVVQHFAALHPQRVVSMALVGVNRSPPEARRAMVRERAAEVRRSGIGSIVDNLLDTVPSPATRATKLTAIAVIRELICGQTDAGYASTCEAMASSSRPDLTSFKAPLLLVAGEHDNVSPPDLSRSMAEEFNAPCHVLPECGHWIPLEQPELLNALLRDFIERTSRT